MVRIENQPKPFGLGEKVGELVLADMRERIRIGKNKYGEELTTNNGRIALVDLYQELLDACMYVRQKISEEKNPRLFAKTYYSQHIDELKEDFLDLLEE